MGRIYRDSREASVEERERLEQADRANIRLLLKHFEQGNDEFVTYGRPDMARSAPGANPRGVTNLIAIPARDGDGEVRGVLVACNMHVKRHVDPTSLRSAGLSFAMFCRNLQAYNAIEEQSERDAPTGLHSRARFDADLPSHPRDRRFSIACLYVDVNGPHELNNQKGHDAGDDMLRMWRRRSPSGSARSAPTTSAGTSSSRSC